MMKRTLSLLLVLSMILSFGLFLTACDKTGGGNETESKNDFPSESGSLGGSGSTAETEEETLGDPLKDPETMPNVYLNTVSTFFGGASDATTDLIKNAITKGSANLIYGEAYDEGAEKLNETLYWDLSAFKLVSQTAYTDAGDNTDVRFDIWADKNSIVASGESLFGSKDAYSVNIDTLRANLKGSEIAKLLEIPAEAMDEVVKVIDEYKKNINKDASAELEGLYKEIFDKCILLTKATMTTEGNRLTMTYTIDNDAIKGALDFLADKCVSLAGDMLEKEEIDALKEEINEAKIELDEFAKYSIVIKEHMPKDTLTLEKLEMDVNITPVRTKDTAETYIHNDGYNYVEYIDSFLEAPITAKLTVTFSARSIAGSVEYDGGDETFKGSASIDKAIAGDITTYTLKVSGGSKNVTADLLKATLSYNKATGALTLSGDYMEDEDERESFSVDATLTISEEEIAAKLTKITMDGETVEMKNGNELSISIKPIKALPAVPANAKDLVTLTKDELETLCRNMVSVPLGETVLRELGYSFNVDLVEQFTTYEVKVGEATLRVPNEYTKLDAAKYDALAAYGNEDTQLLVFCEEFAKVEGLSKVEYDHYIERYMGTMREAGATNVYRMWIHGITYTHNGHHYVATFYQTETAYWTFIVSVPDKGQDPYDVLYFASESIERVQFDNLVAPDDRYF